LTVVGLVVGASLISLPPHSTAFNGPDSGTFTVKEYFTGSTSLKIIICDVNNYKNSGSAHNFTLNQAFTRGFIVATLGGKGLSFLVSNVAQNISAMTALGGGSSGSSTTVTTLQNYSIGVCNAAVDSIQEPGGNAGASTGLSILVGI
jgi:hypothetical protein